MARREQVYVVEAEGRDHGKRYFIREWTADRAEDWGVRALIAIARSGADIPDAVGTNAGMMGVAMMGLRSMSNIDSKEVTGLLNELLECVQIMPNDQDDRVKRPLGTGQDDIEEVTTRLRLKSEVFALHTGFSLAEVKQKLISAVKSLASLSQEGPPAP